MIAPHRVGPAVLAIVTVTVAGLLLGGCAAPAPVPPPTATGSGPPAAAAAPTQAPVAVELPWPVSDAAGAAALQTAVDGGAQPWLLDPSDVALAYVATTHGWTGADATEHRGGPSDPTTVEVGTTDGRSVTLTLTQPVRPGTSGIWLVTAETPT